MSTAELQAIDRRIEALLRSQEADRKSQETVRKTQEADREADREEWRSLHASQAETGRMIKEIGKLVGNIGNKFGSFTEGMASKSIRKILMDQFGMESVGYFKIAKNGKQEQYDLLSYCNGEVNKGIIVEIKSKLDTDVLDQLERKLRNVFDWLPDHRGKAFEGMVAYVHAEPAHEDELREKILAKGWHLLTVGEDVFEVEDPKGFVPTQYRYQKA